MLSPPIVSRLHILFGWTSDEKVRHLSIRRNAVLRAKLRIKLREILYVTGAPGIDPGLDRLPLLILPIK